MIIKNKPCSSRVYGKVYSKKCTNVTTPCRRCGVKPVCHLDHTIYTSVCKVAANIITYPIETLKLLKQTNKLLSIRKALRLSYIPKLYTGINVFLPYNIVNNVMYNGCYFTILNCLFGASIAHDVAIFLSCIISCILTSIYKIPMTTLIKNVTIGRSVKLRELITSWKRNGVIILLEEIPDVLLRYYMKHMMNVWFPLLNPHFITFIIGFLTAVVLTPIDMKKIKIVCCTDVYFSPSLVWLKFLSCLLNTLIFCQLLNVTF